MAVAGWDGGYGESIPVSGSVELIEVGGTVLADYGLDVMAGSLACLEGDRVAFSRQASDGGGASEPSTIVIASSDGTSVELTTGQLAVVQHNGSA